MELALGLLALPMTLGELWQRRLGLAQDPNEIGSEKDTAAVAMLGIGCDIHRGQLCGNGGSRPGISCRVGDLVVSEREHRPIAGTSVLFLGQIHTQDKFAETTETGFVGYCRGSFGNNLVLMIVICRNS